MDLSGSSRFLQILQILPEFMAAFRLKDFQSCFQHCQNMVTVDKHVIVRYIKEMNDAGKELFEVLLSLRKYVIW